MPLTLNVGLTRKIGLPNYGSVGATCAAQLELEPLVFYDMETLQRRIQEAFYVCRRAVDEELSRNHSPEPTAPLISGPDRLQPGVGREAPEGPTPQPSLATSRQLDFMYHLARQIRDLGCQRLELLTQHVHGHPLVELTAAEASRMIELLKELRSGARTVTEFLPEAAA
jgi:hypothetical protein